MKNVGLFFLFCLISIPSYAQNKTEFRLSLRDGSIVTGTSKISSISLLTDYGKLEIPIKNISSLTLGIGEDKTKSEKIVNLLKQLSNSNEEIRSSAYNELIKMDVTSIPAIDNYIYSDKYQSSEFNDFTPESALKELKFTHNVDENYSTKDVIFIDNEYNIGGIYSFNKIDISTEYGVLSIAKEKIKTVDILYYEAGDAAERGFKLNASKHISSNPNGGWLKTGIMVKSGQKITITANGEVILASLSGNKYKPDGSTSSSSTTDAYVDDGAYDDYGYNSNSTYPSYGNVVYKIGESGQAMKAGARVTAIAKSSGMIYISIYETVYNATNSGFYNVKASVK